MNHDDAAGAPAFSAEAFGSGPHAGVVAALLDTYADAVAALKSSIEGLSDTALAAVVDAETADPDCRSIQTVLAHVVGSGYNYAVAVRRWLGEDCAYQEPALLDSAAAYAGALDAMLAYNVALFRDHPDLPLEAYAAADKIKVRWGQLYDVEQLYEHAILHVWRHRRQIETFKRKLEGAARAPLYHNRRFTALANSENGAVSEGMVFHYQQEGNVLRCRYSGPEIRYGQLIGLVDAEGRIDMRYHQVDRSGTLMTGICRSTPERLPNGKIRLHESWRWTSGDGSEGTSTLEEI